MQAGNLDQQIKLFSVTESTPEGELDLQYQYVCTVWSRIISQKGSEAFESAKLNAKETIRVLVRYRDDVTAKWQIEWQGRKYSVVTPPDRSERRKGNLWLTCQAVGIV